MGSHHSLALAIHSNVNVRMRLLDSEADLWEMYIRSIAFDLCVGFPACVRYNVCNKVNVTDCTYVTAPSTSWTFEVSGSSSTCVQRELNLQLVTGKLDR